jgi:membrane-associated HD superfamily phosphohydrolase
MLALSRVFDRWLSVGVASAGAVDSVHGPIVVRSGREDRRMLSDSIATFSTLVSRARLIHPDATSSVGDPLYIRLLATFFHPTIVFDRAATDLRREDARRSVSVSKHDVLAGEKIVGANEVVGREQNEKLRALHDAVDAGHGGKGAGRRVIGSILFDFLLIALLGLTIVVCHPQLYENFRWLLTVAALATFVLLGGAVVALLRPVHPELVPVAFAAVVLSALFERRISIIAAMVLATLVAGQSVFRGTNALFISLVGGAVAAATRGEIRTRKQTDSRIIVICRADQPTAPGL